MEDFIDSFGSLDDLLRMKLQINQEMVQKDQLIWKKHLSALKMVGKDS